MESFKNSRCNNHKIVSSRALVHAMILGSARAINVTCGTVRLANLHAIESCMWHTEIEMLTSLKNRQSEISMVIGECDTKYDPRPLFYIPFVYKLVLTSMSSVDGGWDEWSEWTACSAQCERQRWRECTAPAPRNRGRACEGKGHDVENCTGDLCTQGKACLEFYIIISNSSIIIVWFINKPLSSLFWFPSSSNTVL